MDQAAGLKTLFATADDAGDVAAPPGVLGTTRPAGSSARRRCRAIAVAANAALLQNFQDLLTSLIGLSLTERLLSPVWDKPSSGQAEQDTAS